MAVWDQLGEQIVSPDDRLCRLVYSRYVAANEEGNVYLPVLIGKLSFQMALSATAPGDAAGYQARTVGHKTWRTSNSIYWARAVLPGEYGTIIPIPSYIVVFIYT